MPVSRSTVDPTDLARRLLDIYSRTEQRIAEEIASRLNDGIELEDWMSRKLAASGDLRRWTQQLLDRMQGEVDDSIGEDLLDAYRAGGLAAQAELGAASGAGAGAWNMAAQQFGGDVAVQALQSQFAGKLGKLETPVARWAQDSYQKAVMAGGAPDVLLGTMTRRQATQKAWEGLLNQGITGFTDKAGRRWNLSSYVEMATRTTVAHAAVEGHLDRLASVGVNLVIVSNAPANCPKCGRWEGRVLEVDGLGGEKIVKVQSELSDDYVEVHVAGSVGEATAAGLFHPHCRHSLSAYIPGLTEAPSIPVQHPEQYIATQEQRALERRIRNDQLQIAGALDDAAATKWTARLDQHQAQLRDHIAANGDILRFKADRVKVDLGMVAPPAPTTATVGHGLTGIQAEIVDKGRSIAGGQYGNEIVSLTDLRSVLTGTKAEQDAALLDLLEQRRIILFGEANQKALTELDRAAAIEVGGHPKHLIRIKPDPAPLLDVHPALPMPGVDPAVLAKVRAIGDVATELESIVAREDRELFAARLKALGRKKDPDVKALIAELVDDGRFYDSVPMLQKALVDAGGYPIGVADQIVRFDPALHVGAGVKPTEGALVQIVRPGIGLQEGAATLERAQVHIIDASKPLVDADALSAAPLRIGKGPRDVPGTLTSDQGVALREYSGAHYDAINTQLRGLKQTTDIEIDLPTTIATVDRALADSALTSDVIVWRGTPDASRFLGDLSGDLVGKTWVDPAYVSTAAQRKQAEFFTSSLESKKDQVLMKITVPRGAHGVQMSAFQTESELLLERDLTFRVVADKGKIKGVRIIEVEVVPKAVAPKIAQRVEIAAAKPGLSGVEAGDFTGLKRIGPQKGSNLGGLFEAPDGTRYYVKAQKSAEHAANEVLTTELYRAMGIDIPQVTIGTGVPEFAGSTLTASKIVEGASDLARHLDDSKYLAELREGFAADAWLANWDVAGTGFDNVITVAGHPHRVDAGGSLLFRAQGAPKGSAFTEQVAEWTSLRDKASAPYAYRIFEGITPAQIRTSVAKVEAITPEQIRALVKQYKLPDELADKLIARRADVIAKAAAELKTASKAAPVVVGDIGKMTVPQLRAVAKDRGIVIPAKAKKIDIVKLLGGESADLGPTVKATKTATKVAETSKPLTGTKIKAAIPGRAVWTTVNPKAPILQQIDRVSLTFRDATPVGLDLDRASKVLHDYMAEEGEATPWLLRGPNPSPDVRAAIDSVMAQSKLDQPVVLWRGMAHPEHLFGDALGGDLTGKTFVDHSYGSTTPVRKTAERYAGGKMLTRLEVEDGTGAIFLGHEDTEILLDRDVTLRVIKDTGPGTSPRVLTIRVSPKDIDLAPKIAKPAGDIVDKELSKLTVPELKAVAKDRGPKPIVDPRFAKAATDQKALDATPLALDNPVGLTDVEIAVLEGYQGEEAYAINPALREVKGSLSKKNIGYGIDEELIDWIKTADSALSRSQLKSDIVVYRGVAHGDEIFGQKWTKNLTGASIIDHGFWSTSIGPDIARQFALSEGHPEDQMILRVIAPKSTPAIRLSGFGGEGEILLGRGNRYRIIADHGVVDGVRQLDVEVVPKVIKTAATKVAKPVGDIVDKELSTLTVPELKAVAKDRGVKVLAKDRKADILAKLTSAPAEAPSPAGAQAGDLFRQAGERRAAAAAAGATPKPLPVRPSLEAAKTPTALRKTFAEEAKKITGRDLQVDFGQHVELGREHAEGVLRALERFPRSSLERIDVARLGGAGKDAFATASRTGVTFNARWVNDEAAYQRSLADAVAGWADPQATGWNVRGAGSPQAIALHEFGHTLTVGHSYSDQLFREVKGIVESDAVQLGIEPGEYIRRQVSIYGAKNWQELTAEAFADVMINGDKASQLSKRIFALIEKYNP